MSHQDDLIITKNHIDILDNMIWYDRPVYYMIWYDVILYDSICYDMMWYSIILFHLINNDKQCHVIRSYRIQYGTTAVYENLTYENGDTEQITSTQYLITSLSSLIFFPSFQPSVNHASSLLSYFPHSHPLLITPVLSCLLSLIPTLS